MNYLDKLKKKCNLEDNFMNIIYQIFDKLLSFGYITKRQEKMLEKKLYNNIDVVIFGNEVVVDYKSGYYDAIKKELYIKDVNNVEAIYLRILYALTASEISRNVYSIGYSVAAMSNSSYKIIHNDFGINRAIISNLACRLLYTLPTTLSIVPTYRSYENDFLGHKISSDNDIYFLEGRLLSQLCFVLNISEEDFYINLFSNPRKYLSKIFSKSNFKDNTTFLNLLDETSRKYSNYNKLIFLNKILDDNYLCIKKNALKKNSKEKLLKEQDKIRMAISRALEPLIDSDKVENADEYESIEASLSEKIDELEEFIKNNIIKIQELLVYHLFNNELKYTNIEYAIKLKKLDELLLIQNQELENKCYEVIAHKILNTFENTSSNLIEKIKYSLVQEILSSDKYIKIYKNMAFRRLEGIKTNNDNTNIVAITVNNDFLQLVKIEDLDLNTKDLNKNATTIRLDSLGYLLNNPSANFDLNFVEKVFTKIKTKYNEFVNIRIENMFICDIDGVPIIVIPENDKFSIIELTNKEKDISCKKIKLSEPYLLFTNNTNTNMPILYNKEENKIKKLFSLFTFFS